jgi:hypothetical protein
MEHKICPSLIYGTRRFMTILLAVLILEYSTMYFPSPKGVFMAAIEK